MGYRVYGHDSFDAMLDDLIAFAWSAPMRDLAAQIGISDTGLRKLLKAKGVIAPEQGYWNKLRAGKPTPEPPIAPPRRPGESQRIRVDARFAGKVKAAPPISADGPFASSEVPEDLEELRLKELAAIGHVRVPRDLSKPAPGLVGLLSAEDKRREKFAKSRYSWDAPLFDGPVAQRQLRILNALFRALQERGCRGEAFQDQRQLQARVEVGDVRVGLVFSISSACKPSSRHGLRELADDLPANNRIKLSLQISIRHKMQMSWLDTKDLRIEACLGEVAAAVIVAGEAGYRTFLQEQLEHQEQFRRWEEKMRLDKIAEANAARLAALQESGELLRKAENIRALISRVKSAVERGVRNVPSDQLAAWEAWAHSYADSIDPVLSGQVLRHLVQLAPG